MSYFRIVLGMVGGVFLVLASLSTAAAQDADWTVVERLSRAQALETYRDCGLRKLDKDMFVEQYSPLARAKAPAKQTATINVNYSSNFPSDAQAAFQRAVEIWEMHIASPVTIRIDADWTSLQPNVLGGAGPTYVVLGPNSDGQSTIFGGALADAVSGTDQSAGNPDIFAQFNSSRTDWHFGEGPAPANTIDFTSIVLHEIGHGLHYFDFLNYNEGTGSYGFDFDGNGQLEGDEQSPGPFGRRLVLEEQATGSLASLTNEARFPNPSEPLGDALTSNRLFFEGEEAIRGAQLGDGPIPPKIYAPSPFEPGSSIAHLDELTYPAETANALMTPQIGTAETNRLPGAIVCGQLPDMGWTLGTGCQQYFRDLFAVSVQEADGQSGRLTLSWSEREDANIQEYIVDRQYFGGAFKEIERVDAAEVSGTSLTVESQGLGALTYRLRWVRADGSTATSPEQVRDTITVQDVATSISGRDEQERGTVDLSWTVPPGTSSDFEYRVERRDGETGSFEPVATVPQTDSVREEQSKQYTAERQTPGRYEYRVRAQDEAGNAVTSAAREVEVDFEGEVYALGPYPNPVRETASFDLTARESQDVQVEIYNTLGEQVYSDEREVRAQDPTFLSIDVSQWASGVYFLRLRGDGSVGQTKKMIVVQ